MSDNTLVSMAKLSAHLASVNVSESYDTSPTETQTETWASIIKKPTVKQKPTVNQKPQSGLTKKQHIENLRMKLNGTTTISWGSDSDDE